MVHIAENQNGKIIAWSVDYCALIESLNDRPAGIAYRIIGADSHPEDLPQSKEIL